MLVILDNNGEVNYWDECRVFLSIEYFGNEFIEIEMIYFVVSVIKKICVIEIIDFLIKLLFRIF